MQTQKNSNNTCPYVVLDEDLSLIKQHRHALHEQMSKDTRVHQLMRVLRNLGRFSAQLPDSFPENLLA